jgi:hypothetical protein
MRGEHAVIHDEVDRGAGDEGRELFQELDRLEERMRGAIAPHRLELDEDASIGAEAEAVLGERGAEEVAGELLEAGTIVRGDPDVGVEIEAIEAGLARAAGGDVAEGRPVAEAVDAGAGAGAEGDAAMGWDRPVVQRVPWRIPCASAPWFVCALGVHLARTELPSI